jgi:hypothetical protein
MAVVINFVDIKKAKELKNEKKQMTNIKNTTESKYLNNWKSVSKEDKRMIQELLEN